MNASKNDQRIARILEQVRRLTAYCDDGVTVSEASDDLDEISAGLNALERLLLTTADEENMARQNVDRILQRLERYNQFDFSESIELPNNGHAIDALAAGIKSFVEVVSTNRSSWTDHETKMQTILSVTEAKYKQLFECNPMPLWVLDTTTLRFLDVNDSALLLYGYTREEFLSKTATELRPEHDRPRYLALQKASSLGSQNTGVWTHLKKNGSTIQCEVIVHDMLFEGRRARLVLANDVTEKMKAIHELRISEARFRQLFNSKITGFTFWEDGGKVTDANDLFLDMLGYSREDLLAGRIHLDDLTPPEFEEVTREARKQIQIGGVCEPFEKQYNRKDGTRLPVIVGAANINVDNSSIAGVSCVMDISQRKKMEMEIISLNGDLEAKISERTQALQAVNKELEAFTYSVSHDLRAPLRAIHGYSQMLTEDYEEKLDQEALRLLNAIKHNATHMGRLVDDLLAFSRLGKRPLSQSDTDLNQLVRAVLDEIAESQSVRARLTIHPLGIAKADEYLLRQAFHNLISNALKYSSKREDAQVDIGKIETKAGIAYFVKDNGAGFDMAYYKKLFGVFQRLHEQEEFEGTGVGLAIVQRIVQRHGGKIWAEAKVDEGAVFYFTLGNKRHARRKILS